MQPSASKTDLLLACPRPFEIEVENSIAGEPARYGSAFHQILAACLRRKTAPLEKTAPYMKEVDKAAARFDVKGAAAELAGHVRSSAGVLRNWLAREKLEVIEVETAYAINAERSGLYNARPIEAHDDEHHYDAAPHEIPGTVDLIVGDKNRRRLVVIDHKTGAWGDSAVFATPTKIPQMKTLGLAVNAPNVEVGIFHADRMGLPVLYSEPYEKRERYEHATALRTAVDLVGLGFLRPGPQCGRCPCRSRCPAHQAELISETTEAIGRAANAFAVEPIAGPLVPAGAEKLAIEERAGLLYEVLQKFKKLEEAGRAEIKRLVRNGTVIETRDGKTLAIRTQTYETLSMKSLREALGKVAAEKVIAKLRKQGAVRESTREMLVGE